MVRKKAAVFGAGGLIGNLTVSKLKERGYWVRGVDLKYPAYNKSDADEFIIADLRELTIVRDSVLGIEELYQYAADMGGAGFVFTGDNDADIMSNSSQININTCVALKYSSVKVFYSSSACMYPQEMQHDISHCSLSENKAYPGNPDSEYGWEKLFSERLYLSYARNYNLNVRIARFHNIFGINSCYNNGREKYPAAVAYKISVAKGGSSICMWGDGNQTRSFLNANECVETVFKLMESSISEPLNIGSDEMISCNDLAKMVIEISGKNLTIEHDLTKPQGVRGRNSNNTLIKEKLGYAPQQDLKAEMTKLYNWINKQTNP